MNNAQTRLIADSGSTKTDWVLIAPDGSRTDVHTGGINPARDARDIIYNVIASELLPQLPATGPMSVFFYGAGCIAPFSQTVRDLLSELLPAGHVEVESDMLGAARALCGHTPGIACILGTGANSCYYDGQGIAMSTPALGYILGDEGSGSYLGKRLVGDLFKGILPADLKAAFCRETGLQMPDIIARVYRQPAANAFLASLVPFLVSHRTHPAIHALLADAFRQFIQRNIAAYGHPELPLNCVGGIAHQFSEELTEAARTENMKIGKILRRPIEEMILFHL